MPSSVRDYSHAPQSMRDTDRQPLGLFIHKWCGKNTECWSIWQMFLPGLRLNPGGICGYQKTFISGWLCWRSVLASLLQTLSIQYVYLMLMLTQWLKPLPPIPVTAGPLFPWRYKQHELQKCSSSIKDWWCKNVQRNSEIPLQSSGYQ
jgi:hypothetical protein